MLVLLFILMVLPFCLGVYLDCKVHLKIPALFFVLGMIYGFFATLVVYYIIHHIQINHTVLH